MRRCWRSCASRRPTVLLERLAWGLLIALVGVGAWTIRGGRDVSVSVSNPRLMRFDIATPPTSDPLSFALSPDGRQLAYVASGDGVSRLWVRPLDQTGAQPLVDTAGASFPFWSPDSQSIGFFADGELKRIDITGGRVRTLADSILGRGGTWNRENVILFSPNATEIFRVSANGGDPVAVTRVDRPRQADHRFPYFLPDGRHFVFFARGDSASGGVYLGSLDKPEAHRLLDVNAAAVISAGGHLLFVRENSLFAQALDPQRAVLVGDPMRVAEQITLTDGRHTAAMSAAAVGMLAYRTGAVTRRLAWFDRAGKEIAHVAALDTGGTSNPELSRDGRWIALDRVVNGNRDIWLVDATSGTPSRFSFDQAPDHDAVWSPDQRRIVFASNRTGVTDLYQKLSSGPGEEEALIASPQHKRPLDFSPDGRYLLYREFHSETSWDLLALPLTRDRKPSPVVRSPFEEREGQFSPDGKWVAYQSNDTGSFEIYVQAFPGPGGKIQVSTTGGAQPRWRQDGKELFYIGLDGRMMAVSMQMAAGGEVLQAATPVGLFPTRIAEGPVSSSNNKHQYAVGVDGRRFLINVVPEGAPAPPISIIVAWDAQLRK